MTHDGCPFRTFQETFGQRPKPLRLLGPYSERRQPRHAQHLAGDATEHCSPEEVFTVDYHDCQMATCCLCDPDNLLRRTPEGHDRLGLQTLAAQSVRQGLQSLPGRGADPPVVLRRAEDLDLVVFRVRGTGGLGAMRRRTVRQTPSHPAATAVSRTWAFSLLEPVSVLSSTREASLSCGATTFRTLIP